MVPLIFLFAGIVAADTRIPASSPASDFLAVDGTGLNYKFCADWNPDFGFRGAVCCGKPNRVRNRYQCPPSRAKGSFCDEMTDQQRAYVAQVQAGQGDVLQLIAYEIEANGNQAVCDTNNGFLVNGKPVLETPQSRVRLKSPHRCTNFGTGRMVGMVEWLGRQVAQKYSSPEYEQVRLLVGDISAPRGGCLSGRSGRRGHQSHTTGQDIDLGFLMAQPGRASSMNFSNTFDAQANWWLLKQVFQNPYACVKRVFLDRKWIQALSRVAANDPDWARYRPLLKHVRRHLNHFHIRIGNHPGPWACPGEPDPMNRVAGLSF